MERRPNIPNWLPGADTQDRGWREAMVTQTLRCGRAETVRNENCRWHPKAMHCTTAKQNLSEALFCRLCTVAWVTSASSMLLLQQFAFLAAFKYHTRKRATIQTPAATWFFCLQHCYSCFPDRVFKTRKKKKSKLKQTSTQCEETTQPSG